MTPEEIEIAGIVEAEKEFLKGRRGEPGEAEPLLVGLGLSGGGIRSATFNLGVLTVLEKAGLLKLADYLSTVSGGGYIGSYVIANRLNGATVENESADNRALKHLRRYGNYLSPSLGAMSADTWTMLMVWFRNTSMMQLFLCSVFAVLLLSPRLWAKVLREVLFCPLVNDWSVPVSIGIFHLIVLALCWGLVRAFDHSEKALKIPPSSIRRSIAVAVVCSLSGCTLFAIGAFRPFANGGADLERLASQFALTLGVCGFYLALFSLGYSRGFITGNGAGRKQIVYGLVFLAASTAICTGPGLWPGRSLTEFVAMAAAVAGAMLYAGEKWIFKLEEKERLEDLVRAVLSGVACGGVSWIGIHVAESLLGDAAFRATKILSQQHAYVGSEDLWRYAIFASPGLLATLGCCIIFLIGVAGRAMPDLVREAWSRLGALIYMKSLGFLLIGVIGVYGPLLILTAWAKWNAYVLASGGVATAVAGLLSLLAAKDGSTSGKEPSGGGFKEMAAKAGPALFIALLLCAVALAGHLGMTMAALSSGGESCKLIPSQPEFRYCSNCVTLGERPIDVQAGRRFFDCPACLGGQWNGPGLPPPEDLVAFHWQLMDASIHSQWGTLWPLFAGLMGLAVFLLWRLDVNEFSINRFYRNRLARCFMGAARPNRSPNPITDFDPGDDPEMRDIREYLKSNSEMAKQTPIPIVNTALNAVGAGNAGLSERRAESFFFTPFAAGSRPIGKVDMDQVSTGRFPGEVTLGSLVAISGAAANPNMGFHTSPAIAFLLTFFNVRLGWWVGIPKRLRRYSKPFNMMYVFFELFGTADTDDAYVNLSDGGHFENLGLYELVRRRCRLIVIGDGEQDDKYVFESLGMAIRRCRIDFDVEITIDVSPIQPATPGGVNGRQWAVGEIHYPDRKEKGYLLYLKSSYTGREPYDVQQYRLQNPEFPQQTTGDQFFNESQFESYRQLGKHAAGELLKALNCGPGTSREQWRKAAEQFLHPAN